MSGSGKGDILEKKNIDLKKMRRQIRFLQILSLSLIVVLIGFLVVFIRSNPPEFRLVNSLSGLPHQKEVEGIISHLQYSGLQRLMNPELTISIDSIGETWTMHNVHRFSGQGEIVLDNGNQGVCGELATYTYQKIEPLFGKDYKIEFVNAAESGYFNGPRATHIVLRLSGLVPAGQVYIIDPSFRRYGKLEDFEDYLFFDTTDPLYMLSKDSENATFPVGTSSPVLIKRNYLISIAVEKNGTRFDKDNYVLALAATKKHNYAGRYIVAMRRNNGVDEILENKHLGCLSLFEQDEYRELKNRMTRLFQGIGY
jgi:hypothetical protein